VADDILAGRLVAPHGFVESGQDYVALRRKRPHRKSSLFCEWLRAEANLFAAEHRMDGKAAAHEFSARFIP
jgi:hypothetical protein